ncbi:YbhB/YbcL family Raf kinase inhibitor-like protein [Companilactobacillus keshanensis]|uniref:YbhB/YbcL family Raf kinase inhibitor-like protein n=1 Tax=Companilactobacillus keshanensis TaxID=2486003 RepID=A0ABW4BTA6_9LACO|nr:YbhB/YbcL family Raf kinase inhibitor-like protein [Companilactobacillus keshanensis]
MKVTVILDKNGYLPAAYTSLANEGHDGQPVISFPIELKDIPKEAVSLAITLIDYDAVPLTGFPFIHWIATNIPAMTKIPADFSRNFTGPQGQNSWVSRFYGLEDDYFTNHYAGPNPPDKPHKYTLTVFALSQNLQLDNGFFYNNLHEKLTSNVLSKSEIQIFAK